MKQQTASVLAALVLLLLALPILHADFTNGGTGGWGENVQIRILDAYGRAVPNAVVNATWDISESRGVTTSRNVKTDANGMTSLLLDNVEFNANDTNYTFTINAGYGQAVSSAQFNASCYSFVNLSCFENGVALPPNPALEPRTLSLPVYLVTFVVRDRYNQPLSVPIVVDGDYSTQTGANGVGQLELDNSTHSALATYSGLKKTVNFSVQNDMTVNISMRLYNLGVRVLDDSGQPLPADVYAASSSQQTDANGWAYFVNLSDSAPLVEVYYGRHTQTASVDLTQSNTTTVLFDIHPPVISNLQSQWDGDQLQVRAVIVDPGQYASGLSGGNASIDIYYITADGVQRDIPMYTVGHDLYEGLIPLPGGVQEVRYTVQAIDAAGNSGSSSDTFVVPTSPQSPAGQNSLPPVQGDTGSIDWTTYVLAFLVLAILACGGYWYYKNKKPPTQEDGRGWTDRTSNAPSKAAADAGPPSAPASPPAIPPRAPPPVPPASP